MKQELCSRVIFDIQKSLNPPGFTMPLNKFFLHENHSALMTLQCNSHQIILMLILFD